MRGGEGRILGIWDILGKVDNQTICVSFGTHHCMRFMSLYSFQTLFEPITSYNKSFPPFSLSKCYLFSFFTCYSINI